MAKTRRPAASLTSPAPLAKTTKSGAAKAAKQRQPAVPKQTVASSPELNRPKKLNRPTPDSQGADEPPFLPASASTSKAVLNDLTRLDQACLDILNKVFWIEGNDSDRSTGRVLEDFENSRLASLCLKSLTSYPDNFNLYSVQHVQLVYMIFLYQIASGNYVLESTGRAATPNQKLTALSELIRRMDHGLWNKNTAAHSEVDVELKTILFAGQRVKSDAVQAKDILAWDRAKPSNQNDKYHFKLLKTRISKIQEYERNRKSLGSFHELIQAYEPTFKNYLRYVHQAVEIAHLEWHEIDDPNEVLPEIETLESVEINPKFEEYIANLSENSNQSAKTTPNKKQQSPAVAKRSVAQTPTTPIASRAIIEPGRATQSPSRSKGKGRLMEPDFEPDDPDAVDIEEIFQKSLLLKKLSPNALGSKKQQQQQQQQPNYRTTSPILAASKTRRLNERSPNAKRILFDSEEQNLFDDDLDVSKFQPQYYSDDAGVNYNEDREQDQEEEEEEEAKSGPSEKLQSRGITPNRRFESQSKFGTINPINKLATARKSNAAYGSRAKRDLNDVARQARNYASRFQSGDEEDADGWEDAGGSSSHKNKRLRLDNNNDGDNYINDAGMIRQVKAFKDIIEESVENVRARQIVSVRPTVFKLPVGRRKWTDTEVQILMEGMRKFGTSWTSIASEYGGPGGDLHGRSQVDLKDKARNELKRRLKNGESPDVFALVDKAELERRRRAKMLEN